MATIGGLLDEKGHEVQAIAPDASVFDAIKSMAEKGIGALLVMENHHLVGIVSERDYARKVILQGRSSKDTPVRDIMTSDPVTIRPGESVDRALEVMTERRFRHLPVVDGERVVGVVSIGDLVRSSLVEKQQFIEQLERYITGH